MKYHKLSEDQFHEMHREFSVFLAAQRITKEDWEKIKLKESKIVDYYLNTFSDMVWERILSDCRFLEFITSDQLYLFETKSRIVNLLILKIDSKLAAAGAFTVATGMILPWAAPAADKPTGYLLCDGSAVSRSTYSALFALISTTHGAGNGLSLIHISEPTRPY